MSLNKVAHFSVQRRLSQHQLIKKIAKRKKHSQSASKAHFHLCICRKRSTCITRIKSIYLKLKNTTLLRQKILMYTAVLEMKSPLLSPSRSLRHRTSWTRSSSQRSALLIAELRSLQWLHDSIWTHHLLKTFENKDNTRWSSAQLIRSRHLLS